MEKNIEEYLHKRTLDMASDWAMGIEDQIETMKLTPIEALFFIEWAYQIINENFVPPDWAMFYIYPQHEIVVNGRKYRVDFLIKFTADWKSFNKNEILIVELDSYMWHGKTPEQFEKEKKRERELIQSGYRVMRFSGREILKDVEKCVEQTIEFLKG